MEILFGILALAFLVYAGILHLKSNAEEEPQHNSIFMKTLCEFTGIMMGIYGTRVATEKAVTDYD